MKKETETIESAIQISKRLVIVDKNAIFLQFIVSISYCQSHAQNKHMASRKIGKLGEREWKRGGNEKKGDTKFSIKTQVDFRARGLLSNCRILSVCSYLMVSDI